MDNLHAVDSRVWGLTHKFGLILMGDQRYSGVRWVQAHLSLVPGVLAARHPE